MSEITLKVEKGAVASIDVTQCCNCGECEDYCPVGAISEKQKSICHLCPDCTEMKAMTPDKIEDMQKEACTLACPLGISPQGYINLIKADKNSEAYNIIYKKNPLPSVCGFICHHPCEEVCKRGTLVESPMEICNLKKYLGRKYVDAPIVPYPILHDKYIAIVGAGPAGLTAAHELAQAGYHVTVFEQHGEAGGMLIRGIPSFRLDKELTRREIMRLEKAGIRFKFNCNVNKNFVENELLKNYDKVIIATGMQKPGIPPIKGYRNENICTAIQLMEKVNSGKEVKIGGHCVVIGGGSVATDTARTALRLGAEKVSILCLESRGQMPAHDWEIQEALEEGIELVTDVAVQEFLGMSAKLHGLRYVSIQNFDPKTMRFEISTGIEKTLKVDYAIFAIGQCNQLDWVNDSRWVLAGDILGGACSVIDAMASGRQAALDVDNELSGRQYKPYEVDREIQSGDLAYKIYPANRRKLEFPKLQPTDIEKRIHNFDLVDGEFTDSSALMETYRCLECGYRSIDTENCIGCGVCQKVCPKGNVISMAALTE